MYRALGGDGKRAVCCLPNHLTVLKMNMRKSKIHFAYLTT